VYEIALAIAPIPFRYLDLNFSQFENSVSRPVKMTSDPILNDGPDIRRISSPRAQGTSTHIIAIIRQYTDSFILETMAIEMGPAEERVQL
jgi:hypothetical protein